MLRCCVVGAAVVAIVVPAANAQLEIEYDPFAETITLNGSDTGFPDSFFSPGVGLFGWSTSARSGDFTDIGLVTGTHVAGPLLSDIGLRVHDEGLSLVGIGPAFTEFTVNGLGVPLDASALSPTQSAYLAANDGLLVGFDFGSGWSPLRLSVTPAPGALALFGAAGLGVMRRRR